MDFLNKIASKSRTKLQLIIGKLELVANLSISRGLPGLKNPSQNINVAVLKVNLAIAIGARAYARTVAGNMPVPDGMR